MVSIAPKSGHSRTLVVNGDDLVQEVYIRSGGNGDKQVCFTSPECTQLAEGFNRKGITTNFVIVNGFSNVFNLTISNISLANADQIRQAMDARGWESRAQQTVMKLYSSL